MKPTLLKKFAFCALLICMPVAESSASAGKFNFVIGDVRVVNMMGERKASRGSEVEEQEIIVSGKNGMAQLRMSDGAFIAVRADTELRIDKFQYSGKADASSETVLSLVRGTLRAFTGAIAGFNKDKFKMKTRGATIGIRGSGNVLHFSPSDNVTLNHTISGSHTVTTTDPSGALRTLVTNPGQTIQINALGAMQLVPTPAFILSAAAGVPDSRPPQQPQQPQNQQPGTDGKGPASGEQGQVPDSDRAVGGIVAPTIDVKPELRGKSADGAEGVLNPADPAKPGGVQETGKFAPAAEMSYTDPTTIGKYAAPGVYDPALLGRTSISATPVAVKYDPSIMTSTYNPALLSDGYKPAFDPIVSRSSYVPTTYIARYGYDASGELLEGYILVEGIPVLASAAPYGYQYDFYGKLVLAKGFALDASGSPYPTGAIANYGYTLDASGRPTLLADYALDAYGNPYPIKMPPDYGYTHDTFGNLVLAPGFSYVDGVPTATKVITTPYGYAYDPNTGVLTLLSDFSIDIYGNPYPTSRPPRYGYTRDPLGNLVLAPGFELDASGTPYSTGKLVANYGYTYIDGVLTLQTGFVLDEYKNPYLKGFPPPTGYTYNISGMLVLAPGYTLVGGVPTLGGPVAPYGYYYEGTVLRLQTGYLIDTYGNPYPEGYKPAYGYTYNAVGALVLAPGFALDASGSPYPTGVFVTPGFASAPASGNMYDAFAKEVPIPKSYQNIGYMYNLDGKSNFFEIALNTPDTTVRRLDGGLISFQLPMGGTTSTNNYQLDIYEAKLVDFVLDEKTGMSWGRWSGGLVLQTQLSSGGRVTIDQARSSLHWFSTGQQTQGVTLPITGIVNYTWIGGTQPTDNFGTTGMLDKAMFSADFSKHTVDVGLNVRMPASLDSPMAPVTLNASALNVPILPGGNFLTNTPTVSCADKGCVSPTGSGVIGGQFTAPNGAGVAVGYGLNNGAQTVNGVAAFRQ